MARLRVAAAQINVTVGDLAGNVERVLAGIEAAEAAGADLVAFPELAITGYPPEDLLLRPAFVAEAQRALEKVAARTGQTVAADHSVPILYVNLVGGQDELVFDGGSSVFDETGHVVARARQFEEDLLIVDLDVRPTFRKRLLDPRGRATRPPLPEVHISEPRPRAGPPRPARLEPPLEPEAEVWSALCLGTGDYVRKNRFSDVVIGLSGGIDSSVVAAVAADALGPEHVTGVLMPSRYSSDHSLTDPEELAAN